MVACMGSGRLYDSETGWKQRGEEKEGGMSTKMCWS